MGVAVNNLIPSLVEDGVFGPFKFVDLKSNDQTEIGVQLASNLAFLDLVVEGSSGEKVFPLVVKKPTMDPEERERRNIDVMFYNEITMYKEILPALGYDQAHLPKMHFGIATEGLHPEDDIVILENLKYKGFVPSKPKVFLDFDHIKLAIKTIAKLHSMSYKLKNENREMFDQLLKSLKEWGYSEVGEQEFDIIKAGALKRGFEAALKKNTSVQFEEYSPLLERSSELMKLISQPEEPFSVICHGDFCNNNLLFKYSETDEPVDCVIFDFQLSLYSSPAVDLMFFLYMQTTPDIREKHWNEILKLYWETLNANCPTSIPSFEEFLEHIGKRAIYGYLISGWFLPLVLDEKPNEDKKVSDSISIEETSEIFRNFAGEKGEEVSCDMVMHLSKMNYLQKFLEFYNEKNNVNF